MSVTDVITAGDTALRAHLDGSVLLDWDAVGMLAALRSPV